MKTLVRSSWIVLAALLISASASADASIEVVESVPLETTLAVPGIRSAQDVWVEMIRNAHTRLDLEQFYVSNQAGQALEPVIQAISDAAVRGVHVRLLVDKNFYATYPETVNQLGSQANIQSRTIDFSQYGGIQHAKYFVADGNNAFVGSQNFDWRALSHIHEVGVRLTDPAVNSDLEKIFEKDWAAGVQVGSTKPAAAPPAIVAPVAPSGDLQVVASPSQANPAGIPDTLTQVVGLISGAHKSVRIQVMEYTTRGSKQGSPAWRALDNAVRKAASQGAQVQLLVDVSDLKKGGADLQALARLHGVEVKSVTIPAFSGGPIDYARLIHSKYLIVDGAVSWVGSENWSEGYFLETRNVGVLIRSQEATNQLIQIFDKVWTSSYATGV